MKSREQAGLAWTEPTVTDLSIHHGLPTVRVVQFTGHEEKSVGSDWLWWWHDAARREWFGMLVQAKRMRFSDGRWSLRVKYKEQFEDLLAASDLLHVPAVYCIYVGGLQMRSSPSAHHPNAAKCADCRRRSISLVPAFQFVDIGDGVRDQDSAARRVFEEGIALEALCDPQCRTGAVVALNTERIQDPDLQQFLTEPQDGARAIAKEILNLLARRRIAQFRVGTSAIRHATTGDVVFDELPQDRGHFPRPYFEHVLRGMRERAPRYVEELLAGEQPGDPDLRAIAGTVFLECTE